MGSTDDVAPATSTFSRSSVRGRRAEECGRCEMPGHRPECVEPCNWCRWMLCEACFQQHDCPTHVRINVGEDSGGTEESEATTDESSVDRETTDDSTVDSEATTNDLSETWPGSRSTEPVMHGGGRTETDPECGQEQEQQQQSTEKRAARRTKHKRDRRRRPSREGSSSGNGSSSSSSRAAAAASAPASTAATQR